MFGKGQTNSGLTNMPSSPKQINSRQDFGLSAAKSGLLQAESTGSSS